MLISKSVGERGYRSSIACIKEHIEDHEKGEFISFRNTKSFLERQYQNLVMENSRLQRECAELRGPRPARVEVIRIQHLNDENSKLRKQLAAIKSTFSEEKTT